MPEHGLWFWLAKLQVGERLDHLSASSRRLEGRRSRQSSEGGRNRHGGCISILGCSAAKAFASSLLNLKAGGADGETPCSHEVVGDGNRHGKVVSGGDCM